MTNKSEVTSNLSNYSKYSNLNKIKDKIKDTKDTKDTIVTGYFNIHNDFCRNLGLNYYITYNLYFNSLSRKEISKKLGLALGSVKKTLFDNKQFYEIDRREGKTEYLKLSPEGKQLVEAKIREYKETQKKAETIAKEVTQYYELERKKELKNEEILDFLKEHLRSKLRPHKDHFEIDFEELDLELQEKLLEEPEEFIHLCKLATDEIKDFNFINIPSKIKLSEADIHYLDKLISTDAVIKIAGGVISAIKEIKFECPECGNTITMPQYDSELREPRSCSCGRRGKFKVLHKTKVNKMDLLIEEFLEDLEDSQQKQLKLEITKSSLTKFNLRKKLIPGTKINIIGILKDKPKFISKYKQSTEGEFYLEANNIDFLEEIDIDIFDEESLEKFKEMSQEINKNGPEKLVDSFAPHIYGLKDLKEAILYQAITPKSKNSRRTLNVLAIGDTATGKTDLFIATENNVFRSLTATEDSSVAGLTVGLVKDEFFDTGGWIANPGVLPKAHNSIAILDEIDKLGEEVTEKIHSAMSRLQVSASKIKGVRLPADTCILAGCNPFSKNPFKEHNLRNWNSTFNIPQSMVNRYDLIFNLEDKVDEVKDDKISKLIHKKSEGFAYNPNRHYDPVLIKKFLLYIKQQPEPIVSIPSQKIIGDFYKECRKNKSEFESIFPVTARLNETLITISKCSAKLRMDNKVNEKDIERAKGLILKSFERVGLKLSDDTPFK